MSSPGCTRHVVKMTSENFLKHLTFRAATAADNERSLHSFTKSEEGKLQNLLRTNVTSAVEAGVTSSNGIGKRLTKPLANPEQNSTKGTLKGVRLASPRTGYGQCAPLERANQSDGVGEDSESHLHIPEHSQQNYGNVDL